MNLTHTRTNIIKMKKKNLLFDLKKPPYSYMIGFIQADGNLFAMERNRGRLSIEINNRDKYILKQFQKLIPAYSSITSRERTIVFKSKNKIYHKKYVNLRCYSREFRETINYYGVPYGRKNTTIEPPKSRHSEIDYWRGMIDGNGSVGFTATGKPFISLVICSDALAEAYFKFLNKKLQVNKDVNRNARDKVYNVMLSNEDAQKLISILYYDNCLSLPRKYKIAKEISKWKRPSDSNKQKRH
jgi:hypothetical protein